MSPRVNIGLGLAKALGTKLDHYNESGKDGVTKEESVFSTTTTDKYSEKEPTVFGWFHSITPTRRKILEYFYHLFPFIHWITRYNSQWFIGDLVAGNRLLNNHEMHDISDYA
jgi:solute carrier family 26 (sodium-independent sulfate anion transporter), member 11